MLGLIRLLVEPGQAVVTCPPTFMHRFFAQVNRCRVLPVPRRTDFSLDLDGVERAVVASGGDARLLFLASPGNPHGLPVPLDQLRRLLALPLVVAVDGAYIASPTHGCPDTSASPSDGRSRTRRCWRR